MIAVTKSLWEYLIPYSIIDPGRSSEYITRIHPRHYEIGESLTILIHFIFSIEAVFEIVHALIAAVQLEVVFTSLIFREKSCSPPYMIFETFLKADLFTSAAPPLTSAHNTCFIGIAMDNINVVDVITGLDVYNKTVCIEAVTVLI